MTLNDIEQAINFWRQRYPSTGEEQRLCAEANALATPYAQMIMAHQKEIEVESLPKTAQRALAVWWEQQTRQAQQAPSVTPARQQQEQQQQQTQSARSD